MAKATLSFEGKDNVMLRKAILSGKKTATTRIGDHGKIGDTFEVSGKKFQITIVKRMTLKQISNNYYKKEGFKSPEEFIKTWTKFRPYKKHWYTNTKVHIYLFKKIG